MNVLLKIAIVLVVGIIGGRVARLVKLPNVSGYLVFGLLLGPSFFNFISPADVQSFNIINELALAAIAFSIGNEFVLKEMKKIGKSIFIITLMEVIGAVLLVFCILFFVFRQPFAFSIVIASMSAATAPAATLLVMKQYNAKGPLTRTILPVVALDDVFGIVVFGIALSVAKIVTYKQQLSVVSMMFGPLIEIAGSVGIGFVLGLLLSWLSQKASGRDELQAIALAAIGVATGISLLLNMSPLLTCIVMGTVLVNIQQNSIRVFDSVNSFAAPIYILFFTLAGASLDLSILKTVGLMGIAYVLARGLGKIAGAWAGAAMVKAEPAVRKYLGLGLLPQGGISIGLMVLVRQQLPDYAVAINTIIMFSVLIYETSGPIFAKIALKKAGEIGIEEKVRKPRRKGKKKSKVSSQKSESCIIDKG
ncbi:MAG TPA: cation:proton antiporter [Clostridia bacterium]|jgi:Kef-type K+ transport system membrane component KefB|nr:cation:proton antiporter [Clostridiaceae bacterium]HOF26228.1 cation:proton antiporter [Clostridia bacterium]HOM35143.1 cation:proton antiporter [Clostridia bacterium]HOR89596.1 cation:proton antiporter [Clostridia bacterium]HOT69992.1 cation:proton antiporter [Clostridia bacterium]